jgi:predicted amidophosphoribosyltransferase
VTMSDQLCPCGMPLWEEDEHCMECGQTVERPPDCPNCGERLKDPDSCEICREATQLP